MAVVRVSKCDH